MKVKFTITIRNNELTIHTQLGGTCHAKKAKIRTRKAGQQNVHRPHNEKRASKTSNTFLELV